MEAEKKQEFKDFSLNPNILINEVNGQEIFKPIVSSKTASESEDDIAIVERFVDAAIGQSQRGKTENLSATYTTSDDPRIDFFFRVLEDTNQNTTINLLERSWDYNPLDTLRLIAYLRDIRNGKAIRYQYYVCLHWIYKNHPRTLLENLKILIECGYWKDPLQLLMIILFEGNISNYIFEEECKVYSSNKRLIEKKKNLSKTKKGSNEKLKSKKVNHIKRKFYNRVKSDFNDMIVRYFQEEVDKVYKPLSKQKIKHEKSTDTMFCAKISEKDETIKLIVESEEKMDEESDSDIDDYSSEIVKQKETCERKRKAHEIEKRHLKDLIIRHARERFNNDVKYRYFHLEIASLFARQLIEDMNNLQNKNTNKISLAAKWAPSLNGHFDKYTLIASSIAIKMVKLMAESDKSLQTILTKPVPIATCLARKYYHKNYIVKLREHLKIPECFMCKNEWDSLPYEKVPSKCMQKNYHLFMKHDHNRFKMFVESKTKISGATLKAPELVERAIEQYNKNNPENKLKIELLEKQWISLKDSIEMQEKNSCFKSSLSICDVSGSMHGTPIKAAIGLTLMSMSFANKPWCDICMTFSETPKFIHFGRNEGFYDKVVKLLESSSEMNTDLDKAFQLILKMGLDHKLEKNEMPKYLFIFTDMEFDQACNSDNTNYEEAKRLFEDSGYCLPTIIFWNLRNSRSIPVQKNEQGTILLSGYSVQQFSLLLNMKIDDLTPFSFLKDVLAMKKYENMIIVE